MENDKFFKFIGLAARAGKTLSGAAACESGIKNGKIKLLIVDGEASENTKKDFENACSHYGTKIIVLEENGFLGNSLGKPGIKVTGITDAGFAGSAIEKYGTHSGGENN